MTAMLLALVLSDAALNESKATEYRFTVEPRVSNSAHDRERRWTPGVDHWTRDEQDCPAFFQREIEGFGIVRVGPKCAEEEIPYAL